VPLRSEAEAPLEAGLGPLVDQRVGDGEGNQQRRQVQGQRDEAEGRRDCGRVGSRDGEQERFGQRPLVGDIGGKDAEDQQRRQLRQLGAELPNAAFELGLRRAQRQPLGDAPIGGRLAGGDRGAALLGALRPSLTGMARR
jgi:hypothetical protein